MDDSEEPLEEVEPAEKMTPDALVLLFDNQMACTLAVAWKYCKGDEKEWLDTAGIKPYHYPEALKLCKALRRMNICQPGGVTDDLAIRFITTLATEPVTKRAKDERKKRDQDRSA